MADDLTEYILIADAAGYKLGSLRAEVENEYSFVGRVGGIGRGGCVVGMRHGYRRVKRGRGRGAMPGLSDGGGSRLSRVND